MFSLETCDVMGYRNEVVPCTFFRQEDETKHIAVLFPGYGYTVHMPLMYYPARLLSETGADVFLVGYNYSQRPDFLAANGQEREQWLRADTLAAFHTARTQRDYQQVTLVGKSIGTRAMGHVLAHEQHLPSLRCVWLTPILRNDLLYSQIGEKPYPSLFVAGTADSHHDPQKLAEVREVTGGEILVIENADHSLEIAGDIAQSIENLTRIIAAIQRFLGT